MKNKAKTIKTKILTIIFIGTITFSILLLFIMSTWIMQNRKQNDIVSQNFEVVQLRDQLQVAYDSFNDYIETKDSDALLNYKNNISYCSNNIDNLMSELNDKEIYFKLVGLYNSIIYLDQEINDIISDYNGSITDIYDDFNAVNETYEIITIRLYDIIMIHDSQTQELYDAFIYTSNIIVIASIILIVIVPGILILMCFRLAKQITKPIEDIELYTNEIASGKLNIEDIDYSGVKEMSVISNSLNKMKHRLKAMIEEIKQQSKLKIELRETKLSNLQIMHDLKNSQLQALQSQINPHFLFNTLNCISRIATQENNHLVENMIDDLASMLRFSLNNIHRTVTVAEEVENVNRYMSIQTIRYAGKLKFKINDISMYQDIKIPCMILQPIVENALMHGLKEYDYNGEIKIDIHNTSDGLEISIEDDGVGFNEDIKEKINSGIDITGDSNSTKANIGMMNVILRLNAYYKRNDCLSVESVVGEGSKITIKLWEKRD